MGNEWVKSVFVGLTALAGISLAGCRPNETINFPLAVSSPIIPSATALNAETPITASNDRVLLKKGEIKTLGMLNIINNSEKLEISIIPANLSQYFADKAGLTREQTYPITIVFSDIDDADPTTSELEGASTGFDPKTKAKQGDIAINYFLKLANDQKALPKTTLTTQERFDYYLSVLISQATLVEISNQGNAETINAWDPSQGEELDRMSNALGKTYVNEIIAGNAQPFIIVTCVKK